MIDKTFRYIKYIFIICLLALFWAESLDAKERVLRWAADTESGAPYVFQDPDDFTKLIGFEAEIIRAVCKELGWKETHVQNEWDGLIPGLERGDYDVAINGIEITSDREEVVNFSIPYYLTFQQLVVRTGDKGISTMADLVGKITGTLGGSLAERMLRAQGGIDVRTYDSENNSYNDLKNGRLDAVLIDEPVAKYYAGWNPELELVGQPIGEISYGVVCRKQDTELLKDLNHAIQKLKTSGQLREILERWNLWNDMMAIYLNDPSVSNVAPVEYQKYLESKGHIYSWVDIFLRYWNLMPTIMEAAGVTLSLSIVAMIFAILLGLLLALIRIYAPRPVSALAVIFIEIIRGTPLLMQLFFIFYVLPSIGIKISPTIAAIAGLAINYAAYEAEIYRAGLFSVPRGQMEAAISLGMGRTHALRYIIIPQAVRLVIPPTTNDFIALLKDSSLVSVITLVELTQIYGQIASAYFDYIIPGLIVASIYLLLGLPFVKLSKMAERKYSTDKKIQGKRIF